MPENPQDESRHPRRALSAYADGELQPGETRRVEAHLETCTECARELALMRRVGDMMRSAEVRGKGSVWSRVRRRIARPVGWFLAAAGAVVLVALAVVEWFRTGSLTLEWLAMTSLAVGLALVAVSIGWEQFSEWRESPYRDVER